MLGHGTTFTSFRSWPEGFSSLSSSGDTPCGQSLHCATHKFELARVQDGPLFHRWPLNNPGPLTLDPHVSSLCKNQCLQTEVTPCSLVISRRCSRPTSWIPSRSFWRSSATQWPHQVPSTTSIRPARRAKRSSSREHSHSHTYH